MSRKHRPGNPQSPRPREAVLPRSNQAIASPLPPSETTRMPNEAVLRQEMEELHSYVRSNFQILIGWFTFFCTIVVGASAWAAAATIDGKYKALGASPMLFVAIFYTSQIGLGVLACWYVHRDFTATNQRVEEIKRYLSGPHQAPPLAPGRGVPDLIPKTVALLAVTLVTVIPFLWAIYLLIRNVPVREDAV